jgi:hypothetical protein
LFFEIRGDDCDGAIGQGGGSWLWLTIAHVVVKKFLERFVCGCQKFNFMRADGAAVNSG